MRAYKHRGWLSAVIVLSLLAGACAPATTLADETNDAKTIALSTSAPDLTIDTITWSPENPSIGDKVTFTATIKNQGNVQAGSSHVAYYIDDTHQTSIYVNQIDPGASTTKTFTWTAEASAHTVKAVADSNNSVIENDETNNDKTFAFSVLAADLIIDAISWSPENPSIGDKVTFTATIKNQGNEQAVCSNIDLHIDGNSRGCQDVGRLDPGASTTRTFTWTAQAGVHTIKAITDTLNLVKEGDETNNDKTVNYSTAAPDFIINSITWSPTTATENSTVTFTVIIENQGIGTSDASHVAFYIDDTYQTSVYVGQIDPGGTTTKTFTWAAKAGTHTAKAVANSENNVIESDDTNNTMTVELDLLTLKPDLIIQDITWSPSSPLIAHKAIFTVTVKNQGTGDAGRTRLYFHIDSFYKFEQDIYHLDAGATTTASFSWTPQANSHILYAIIDEENYVSESDEDNNTKTITVTLSNPSPTDLIIQDIVWSPENPSIEDTVTFTVTIKNQGSVLANPCHITYYIDDTQQTSVYVNQIDPGASTTNTFTWTAEAGAHTIKAVVDSNNIISESDETNNEKTVTLSTSDPDLVITNITWSPINPSTGDTVTFTVTIKNQGGVPANLSRVTYYVDGSFRGYHNVSELNAGATVTKTFTWTAEAGAHIIKAVTDVESQIPESNENNNEKALTFPPPDLIIEAISWSPENPSTGDAVIFTVTVKNQGSGRADSSRVCLYVDDSPQDSDNIQELDAGAAATKTFSWTARAGSHTIKATVDGEHNVIESYEANNDKLVTFPVLQSPSSTPAAAPTPSSVTSPEQEEVSVQLLNQSGTVSPDQDIVFDLHAVNPAANPTMIVNLDLIVPAEVSVTSAEFIKVDEGQYTASYSIEPGDILQIEVLMKANQAGVFNVMSDLAYYFEGDNPTEEHQTLSLPILVEAPEAVEEKPASIFLSLTDILLKWWYVLAAVILASSVILVVLRRRHQSQ
jgi:subtilase family serine protease